MNAHEALPGHRAEVYRNLHTGTWSVRLVETGRVISHPYNICLKDARFVVRPAGHAKVLETGVKNVHAFVRGHIYVDGFTIPEIKEMVPVRYDPFKAAHFSCEGEPIHESPAVIMSHGQVFAQVA